MSGLDVAEIQAGGLTIDATTDVTIAQPLTGAGGITKVNTMATSLTGPNTYAGSTLVQARQAGAAHRPDQRRERPGGKRGRAGRGCASFRMRPSPRAA